MRRYILSLIVCLGTCVAGCSKPEAPTAQAEKQAPSEQAASPAAALEPCSLLTSEEIAAVQGEPVQQSRPSQRVDRGLTMFECYFALPTFTNSVSFSVGRRDDGPGGRDAQQYWQDVFNEAALKGSEKSPPPQHVEGLGDDAYWSGNEKMGALHVLAGPHYVRVSVGGPGDQKSKIDKCKALAEIVLKRL